VEADLSAGRETGTWTATGVRAADVAAGLARLHAEHQRHEHLHAAARTLNLVVAPVPGEGERDVVDELDRLGDHSPARAIVLRDHEHERLDAEAVLDCEVRPESGRVGICHDRVLLSADRSRLDHADSLIAPLLVPDLPVIAWLPDPARAERGAVARRADHLVTDSGRSATPLLDHAVALAGLGPVHDLAWGRLERWRMAVAGAWERPERRARLRELREVELRHGADATAEALLLAGWIAARAGLDASVVSLARGEAGIESVRFGTAQEDVVLDPPLASIGWQDAFVRALVPTRAYRSGYPEALAMARALQEKG
jgi:glucose-6-phosphate dehydrogenase assembly protein OpcA